MEQNVDIALTSFVRQPEDLHIRTQAGVLPVSAGQLAITNIGQRETCTVWGGSGCAHGAARLHALGGGRGGCAHGAGLQRAARRGTQGAKRLRARGCAHVAARLGQCCCALGARLWRVRGRAAARTGRGCGCVHKEHGVGRRRECV